MHRLQSESIYSMLSRTTKKQAPDQVLDPGVLEAGMKAVIELNFSDADATYHYISYLMRIATDCTDHFVLSPATAVPKREPAKRANESTKKFNKKIILVDELLLFDVRHYATTVPSAACLEETTSIQDPDPFICLASLQRLLTKDVVFMSSLRLMVAICSDLLVDQVLTIMGRYAPHQSTCLLITPYAPHSKTPTDWRRMRVRMGPKKRITVSRMVGDEESEMRAYDVQGSRFNAALLKSSITAQQSSKVPIDEVISGTL